MTSKTADQLEHYLFILRDIYGVETLLEEKIVETIRAAEFRGHSIIWDNVNHTKKIAFGHCTRCNKETHVILQPAPNQIDISGSAIGTNCITN